MYDKIGDKAKGKVVFVVDGGVVGKSVESNAINECEVNME